MFPAVVLSQYGTRLARPGRHSALAYLAANDRKTTDGHGETAGIRSAHLHPIMPDRPANAYTCTHIPAIRGPISATGHWAPGRTRGSIRSSRAWPPSRMTR